MRYLEVVIRVREENGEMVTETPLDTHKLEMLDLLSVPRQERIDQLEADTLEKGREILRTIFLKQWELLDGVLASSHQHINQDCQAVFDGKTDLKIASRLGILHLRQQVCYCKSCQAHFLPLTQVLPEHQGMIITRGLQEWACLLPQGLPFATAARLLGWQTQEEQVISDTEVRYLVQEHGQVIRQAELAEVKALEAKEDLSELKPNLVPLGTPRRHPAWPAELSAAVEEALDAEDPTPPKGVSRADWERVLDYQREARQDALQEEALELTALEEEAALGTSDPTSPQEGSQADWKQISAFRQEAHQEVLQQEALELTALEEEPRSEPVKTAQPDLSRLGPQVRPGQIVAATDEVKVRAPKKRQWQELRTARVTTPQGYRYLSGTGEAFLAQLSLFLMLCAGPRQGLLTFLGDGAHWIRDFFQETIVLLWQQAELILDWYHLKKKCYQLTSMICRGRKLKKELLKALLKFLWNGQVDSALTLLEEYRPQAKNEEKLDELIEYIRKNRQAIPNYCERRKHRQFNGSAHAEKANDLLVARRQKHRGIHWSLETSDALCVLKTLMLNGGWDLYWQHGQVLPLAS